MNRKINYELAEVFVDRITIVIVKASQGATKSSRSRLVEGEVRGSGAAGAAGRVVSRAKQPPA